MDQENECTQKYKIITRYSYVAASHTFLQCNRINYSVKIIHVISSDAGTSW